MSISHNPASPKLMCDLFCGTRYGWTKGFIAQGWSCIGIDIVPVPDYPGRFIQADIAQLLELPAADFYCCSSPCEQFSVHGMKHFHPHPKWPWMGIALFEHARKLLGATCKPYVMENVRSAQRFLGQAVHHSGSFYLWGNAVPLLLPDGLRKSQWTMQADRPGNAAPEVWWPRKRRAAKLSEIPLVLSSHIAQQASGGAS